MEENRNVNRNNEMRQDADNDRLRGNTMNESIREASSDRQSMDRDRMSEDSSSDMASGVGYNPNDMSATRSGGTTDMDDQTSGGAGLNSGERLGSGSNLTTRRTITGSDFDGQNKTS